jgi:serine/threonine protein kinase
VLQVFAGDFSYKADVWAAGVMLYNLFSGTYPVSSAVPDLPCAKVNFIAHAVKTYDAAFDGDVWQDLSRDGRDFIARCLDRDESMRMDVDAALAHPWIQRLGVPRGSNKATRCAQQLHTCV